MSGETDKLLSEIHIQLLALTELVRNLARSSSDLVKIAAAKAPAEPEPVVLPKIPPPVMPNQPIPVSIKRLSGALDENAVRPGTPETPAKRVRLDTIPCPSASSRLMCPDIPEQRYAKMCRRWPHTPVWRQIYPENLKFQAKHKSIKELWVQWREGTEEIPSIEWLDEVYLRSGWCRLPHLRRHVRTHGWIVRAIEVYLDQGANLEDVLALAQDLLEKMFKTLDKMSHHCEVCVGSKHMAFGAIPSRAVTRSPSKSATRSPA